MEVLYAYFSNTEKYREVSERKTFVAITLNSDYC